MWFVDMLQSCVPKPNTPHVQLLSLQKHTMCFFDNRSGKNTIFFVSLPNKFWKAAFQTPQQYKMYTFYTEGAFVKVCLHCVALQTKARKAIFSVNSYLSKASAKVQCTCGPRQYEIKRSRQ
jgi:hypothetical protein